MKYCSKCVLPDSRPNLIIGEDGVCNACKTNSDKPNIDWSKRKNDFEQLVKHVKANSKRYDCLIPVSGGKDSTWQTHLCLEKGLTPLAVTWATPARTEIGHKNLQNLIDLGVDHIDYRINPEVEKRFMWKAFQKYGTTALPMHMAIFSIPLNIATSFDIPLIIYGENSANEYGSQNERTMGFEMTEEWFKIYGVTHGTTPNDWLKEGFTKQELAGYYRPSHDEIQSKGIRAIFLGEYFKWDPEEVKNIAQKQGFDFHKDHRKTGYYEYADIDDEFISIHHWMKWYKFGFTRLYDNLSLEIRNGRISREKAIDIIRQVGDETPENDIRQCCNFMNVSVDQFYEVAEKFRNHNVWQKTEQTWKIPDFIIEDWNWKVNDR